MPITLVTVLVLSQALGALVGATMAVWSEIAYLRALRDGNIDHAERAHLRHLGRGLQFGMLVLLLSSLGLIMSAYGSHAATPPAFTESYWILMALVGLILAASWALSRGRSSFVVTSAVAFTGWWFLLYLTFGQLPMTTIGTTTAYFVVAATFFTIVLYGNRRLVMPRK